MLHLSENIMGPAYHSHEIFWRMYLYIWTNDIQNWRRFYYDSSDEMSTELTEESVSGTRIRQFFIFGIRPVSLGLQQESYFISK